MNGRILKINAFNENTFYNPEKSIDGGGYFCPVTMAVVDLYGDPAKIALVDNNKGIFGRELDLYYVTDLARCMVSGQTVRDLSENLIQKVHPMAGYNRPMLVQELTDLLAETQQIGKAIARFGLSQASHLFGSNGFLESEPYEF